MNRKVLETMEEFDMLSQGDRVFVALSGGADSVALFHLLCGLRERFGISVSALHLNHLLREEESHRDEQFVANLCRRWNVPLVVERVPVNKLAERHGLSLEECARRVRYRFFARHAQGENAKIATGHTRSDTVETMLLNLVRGTGLKGLAGIPPVRGNVVRPLIRCTREEVEQYCAKNRLSYMTDSTNLGLDYTRNRIRHQVIPLLKEENPRFEALTGILTEQLRTDALYLDESAAEALQQIAVGQHQWQRMAFLQLPSALRPRVLGLLLQQRRIPYGRVRLDLLERFIRRGSGGIQLSKEWAFYASTGAFSLELPRSKPHRNTPAGGNSLAVMLPQIGQTREIPLECGRIMSLSGAVYENYKKTINNDKKLLKNTLDYDRIEKIVNLRHPASGEKIRPLGRGCTKTMKQLWSEEKVPSEIRRRQAALESAGKLIWAEQCGSSEETAPSDQTSRVLVIEIK